MPSHIVLQSWKEISRYVGRTERTLQRWEQEFGFPVHRPSGKSRSAVMALGDEIQEWTLGKPSLVQIRQTARLSQAALRWFLPDLQLIQPAQERNKVALTLKSHLVRFKCLRERQQNLRESLVRLLEEQQKLCAKLQRTFKKT